MEVYREAFGRITAETGRATEAAGGRTPLDRLRQVPEWLIAYCGVPLIVLGAAGAAIARMEAAHRRGSGAARLAGRVRPVPRGRHRHPGGHAACPCRPAGGRLPGRRRFQRAWGARGPWRLAAAGMAFWAVWTGTASWLAAVSRP